MNFIKARTSAGFALAAALGLAGSVLVLAEAPAANAACAPKYKTLTDTGVKAVFRYGCGDVKGYVEDTKKDGRDARVQFSTYGGTQSKVTVASGKGDQTDFDLDGSWVEGCVWRYGFGVGSTPNCDNL
ncbi:hypothetical protein SAMN04487981_10951 [Streptomyces sp. cf386]|uniref:hypothetical protein n=1 Tax=Streptomyces sp. cf386 TaxID=1761904 RepID=UPI00088A1354|nr:hypothetical protein [Streptomyces sp. cf386]SDO20075.1 hypothetical protein SAMN04487981_10951 [Streptomyces sp. cf386]